MSDQLAFELNFDKWPVIYALFDRRDRVTRYIGSTALDPPIIRLTSHCHRYAARRVRAWITQIGRENLGMRVLLRVPPDHRQIAEEAYIKVFNEGGRPLLNVHHSCGRAH